MVFRVQAKNIFLTYPQCDVDPNELLQYLSGTPNFLYARVGREKHEDGNWHLHALLTLSKKRDIRKADAYDYNGFHPNIQAARCVRDTLQYVSKEGNFVEKGDPPSTALDLYEAARTLPRDSFFTYARGQDIQFPYAIEAWNSVRRTDTTIEENQEIEGTVHSIISITDLRTEFKSTILIGPSGIGKTVYAKRTAAKPCLFVTHLDDLKSLDPQRHRSVLFDDMSFRHLPLQSQIHLVDLFEPRTIHVRYGTVKLPARMERWFTCNEPVFLEHPAIARRVNQINLY